MTRARLDGTGNGWWTLATGALCAACSHAAPPTVDVAPASTTAPPPTASGAASASDQSLGCRRGESTPASVDLRILGLNDFHGHLSSDRKLDGRPVGGAAVLAAYLHGARRGFPGRSLIVHAGDMVGASPPNSALLQDEPTIEWLNTLVSPRCQLSEPSACDVVGTFGNHEFDEGSAEALRLIRGGNHARGPFLQVPYPGARFPYVSANVVRADTSEPLLAPSVVVELGGVPVGVIGAVTHDVPNLVTPKAAAGLAFLDEAESINRAAKALRDRGVRTLIVSIHQGAEQTRYAGPTRSSERLGAPLASIVRKLDDEIDLVISGHAHSFSNALAATQNGQPILVTQAFSAGDGYAEIDLRVDCGSREVIAKSAQIVPTYADSGPGSSPNSDAAAVVARADVATAPLVSRVIVSASHDLRRARGHEGESALGDLIADAHRAALRCDVALMNPGGIRADLEAGPVTWGELFAIQPFGNDIVAMTLSGRQLLEALNSQFAHDEPRFYQISGMRYSWDAARKANDRVVQVLVDGKRLQPTRDYRVCLNSYLAVWNGSPIFVSGRDRVTGGRDIDATVDYLQKQPQPLSRSTDGRIQRVR